jgi:hypothetical protein
MASSDVHALFLWMVAHSELQTWFDLSVVPGLSQVHLLIMANLPRFLEANPNALDHAIGHLKNNPRNGIWDVLV